MKSMIFRVNVCVQNLKKISSEDFWYSYADFNLNIINKTMNNEWFIYGETQQNIKF